MLTLGVAVVGTGYVGLVTGACLAELGHRIVCIDTDAAKIDLLRSGQIPIYEPGLDALVARNAGAGRLQFSSDLGSALAAGADVVFIAVGTPTDETAGRGASLAYVQAAVDDVGRALAARPTSPGDFTVVVTKSTVPVGTSRQIAAILGRHLARDRFAVASNPEFLREGNAIADFMQPDRIVVGSQSDRARELLGRLYLPLTSAGRPLLATTAIETAELIKYAANAFLATKVTFINELARLCEATGADVTELALGIGLDSRIGPKFLTAGPGFGGSCFPKDLVALIKTANDFGSPVEIVETVIRANDRHKQLMVRKIRNALGGSLAGCRLAVLGLAFKADTDDMRNAPSLTIVGQLMSEGAAVRAYDPAAGSQAATLLPGLDVEDDVAATVKGADAVIVMTEWSKFRSIGWADLAPTMRRPLLIDLRNVVDADGAIGAGFEYLPLGRPAWGTMLREAAE